MKFEKIVVIDDVNLTPEVEEEIAKLSHKPVRFPKQDPANEEEIINTVGDADAILVSWRTPITKGVLERCTKLKYVGVCATSTALIDVGEAKRRKITVTNVHDYGDEATAEYIFAQLLVLVRGFGKYQWGEFPCELNGKKIGIVGLGAVGKQVARLALGFNMEVLYFSRTRNEEYEKKGLVYKNLHDLLRECEIITLHVPKDTSILGRVEFDLIQPNAILIDTCLGKVFEPEDFEEWIKKGENFAIFDYSASQEHYGQFSNTKNVISPEIVAGRTVESKQRLSQKVLQNIASYFESPK